MNSSFYVYVGKGALPHIFFLSANISQKYNASQADYIALFNSVNGNYKLSKINTTANTSLYLNFYVAPITRGSKWLEFWFLSLKAIFKIFNKKVNLTLASDR